MGPAWEKITMKAISHRRKPMELLRESNASATDSGVWGRYADAFPRGRLIGGP